MSSPWPPSTKARDVLDRDLELLGEEVAEASGIEHAGHADDHVARQAGELLQRPHHRVERVGDADHEGVRRILLDAGADLLHDLEVDAEEIVAAHAGLARHAGGDDAHVGALDIGVSVGALELAIEAVDRAPIARCRAPCPGACLRRCRREQRRRVPSGRRDGRACRRSGQRRSARSWSAPCAGNLLELQTAEALRRSAAPRGLTRGGER